MELPINRILQGHVLARLRELPDESVNCVITSPPYWALRAYKTEPQIWNGNPDCEHQWGNEIDRVGNEYRNDKNILKNTKYEGQSKIFNEAKSGAFCLKCPAWRGELGLEPDFNLYISHLIQIFDEVKRVLRKDGTCWVNLGDTFFGSGKGAGGDIENSKQVWTFDEKNKKPCANCGKEFNGWAFQNFCSKACAGVDNTPRREKGMLESKSLCMIPYRFAIEMQNKGWVLRNILIWWKPNCMPSSVKDRFTVDFEPIFFFSKSKKYFFEQQHEAHLTQEKRHDGILRQRTYSYKGKYSSLDEMQKVQKNERAIHGAQAYHPFGRNMRAVWKIITRPFSEAHFATFPENLVMPMIKAGCPEFVCSKCGKPREKIFQGNSKDAFNVRVRDVKKERIKHIDRIAGHKEIENYQERITHVGEGKKFIRYSDCGCNCTFQNGIVLDPFVGAGTTALVALKLNRNFIGIELNHSYIEIANKRIAPFLEQKKLTEM